MDRIREGSTASNLRPAVEHREQRRRIATLSLRRSYRHATVAETVVYGHHIRRRAPPRDGQRFGRPALQSSVRRCMPSFIGSKSPNAARPSTVVVAHRSRLASSRRGRDATGVERRTSRELRKKGRETLRPNRNRLEVEAAISSRRCRSRCGRPRSRCRSRPRRGRRRPPGRPARLPSVPRRPGRPRRSRRRLRLRRPPRSSRRRG